MEGELWKWTNYWNGWQSRWFILDDGVLSYFKSYEEVSQGCKGSISLNVCEIIVNPTDATRLDLNVSNEQYIYLKANNEKERQQWLVALGSAKATLANRQQRRRISSTTSSDTTISSHQAIPQLHPTSASSGDSSNSGKNQDTIKAKKSELRLYCDLLVQQVHTVKNQEYENGTNLLAATCDTFINTLDELMEMADSQLNIYENGRRNSRERSNTPTLIKSSTNGGTRARLSSESSTRTSPTIVEKDEGGEEESNKIASGFKDVFGNNGNGVVGSLPSTPNKKPVSDNEAFALRKAFPVPTSDHHGNIKTTDFISASLKMLLLYDFFGKSFLPIRNEVKGHLKGLETKYLSDQDTFKYIQNIVQVDKLNKKSKSPNSATVALVWVLRHLMFLQTFLNVFMDTDDDVNQCLNQSYDKVLAAFHDTVIQSVFGVAIQSAPCSRTCFFNLLFCGNKTPEKSRQHLATYLQTLDQCLQALKESLESDN